MAIESIEVLGPVSRAAYIVLMLNSAFNVMCSVLVLGVIYYMRKHGMLRINAFLQIVISMTIFQLLYDCTFFGDLPCADPTYTCAPAYYGLFSLVGVAAAFCSMHVIFTVSWMMETGYVVSKRYMLTSGVVILSVSLIACVVSGAMIKAGYTINDSLLTYQILRYAIIAGSVLLLILITFRLYQRTTAANRHMDPIYHLLKRLAWYPVVQVSAALEPHCAVLLSYADLLYDASTMLMIRTITGHDGF
jgi:hypothetical protein